MLGPVTNQFNAATEAAAKTALDTYSAANDSWLEAYDSNRDYYVELSWPTTPDSFVNYTRRGGAWLKITEVIRGKPGPTGPAGRGVPEVDAGDAGSLLRVVTNAWATVTSIPASLLANGTIEVSKLSSAIVGRLLPTGIATGKFLRKTDDGWAGADAPAGGGGGTTVEANPSGDASRTLVKLLIGAVVYKLSVAWGDITGKPGRLEAFTQSFQDKLTGIEAGAEVNPKHIVSFRTEDGNSVIAGVTHFYDADNSQWQSGAASANVVAIEIDSQQLDLMQNPQTDNASYTGWHSLPQDLVDNGGSSIWNFHYGGAGITFPNDPSLVVQADTVVKNDDGNYVLQALTFLQDFSITGTGYNWQVAAVFAPPSGADAIVGTINKAKLPPDVVYAGELAGKESDRYASYNNAFVGNTYRSGNWVLSTDTAGPPTTPNLIRQPDIATGSGVIALGRLRTDADPNELVWAPVPTAADYASGDVIYASLDRDKGSHLQVTLTSDMTLVGTGDAAYIWATASWVEVGNIANVQTAGDYFKLAAEEPTGLKVEIPATDVLGAPWLNVDGSNVTEETKAAIQGRNEAATLDHTFRVDVTNVNYYVSITDNAQQKNIRIRIPSTDSASDAKLTRILQRRAWVRIGDWYVWVTTNVSRSTIGTSITYSFDWREVEDEYITNGPKPTGSTPQQVEVIGEDVHRGELADVAFTGSYTDLSNKPTVYKGNHTSSAWTVIAAVADGDILDISAVVQRTSSSDWYTGEFTIDAANLTTTEVWTTRTTDQGARLEWRKNGGNLEVRAQGTVFAGYYVVTIR